MAEAAETLAPRHSRVGLFAPFVLLGLVALAWSVAWFVIRQRTTEGLDAWLAAEAAAGRRWTCADRSVGGYPFRIEVTCAGVAAELKDAQPPIAIKLKQILAVAQVWDPRLIIAEFTGPLTASDAGGAPYVTATWGIAQASVRGTPKAPERASVVVDGLRLDGAQGNLFDSKRAEFHARVQYGSWPHNPAVDVVVKLVGAAAPAVHALAAQPFDADILAVLHGIKDLAPKPMPARLREWQAAGGRLEIQNARLAQAESLANATGTLALTQQGRLDGALRLTVAGIERFMPTIGGEKGASLSLDRVAPALNAIERAVPGLAQRIPPQRQQSLQTGLLALLGQPAEIEGKQGIAAPLRFTDGKASLGPFPLGQVPPAF